MLPPNITPPLIIRYSASSVPVLSLAVSSKTLSEQELYDYDLSFVRQQLATVQGASVPLPYGGKPRQIMVDINSAAMYAKGISPNDVTNALNAQNLILPAGTVKIDQREYLVKLNGSPDVVSAFNDLPVKSSTGPSFTCATWRRFTTATRCRRTSCARTGFAARCSACSRARARARWTSSNASRRGWSRSGRDSRRALTCSNSPTSPSS